MTHYQIETGAVRGFMEGDSAGHAFRKLLSAMKMGQDDYGQLARFREVQMAKGFRFRILSPWFYQDPDALRKQP